MTTEMISFKDTALRVKRHSNILPIAEFIKIQITMNIFTRFALRLRSYLNFWVLNSFMGAVKNEIQFLSFLNVSFLLKQKFLIGKQILYRDFRD